MKFSATATIVNHAFKFVVYYCNKYNIDESHGLKHSMDVLHTANKIYNSELENNPLLFYQKDVIFASAILHDMCDKKYNLQIDGMVEINNFMKNYLPPEKLETVSNIISTMSYSHVKKNGYPDLHEYQLPYHIVREADLLTAYDVDRCIIYGMMMENHTYSDALERARYIFKTRVLKYRTDKLFITDYSNLLSLKLHMKALEDLEKLNIIL